MKPHSAIAALACITLLGGIVPPSALSQMTAAEKKPAVGDSPADPGPLASDLSGEVKPAAIQAAMRKVADWQDARIADKPSQDWTFATLYIGMLSASQTLNEPRYRDTVLHISEHFNWTLGPRQIHADDQAIGQSHLWLYAQKKDPVRITPLRTQYDEVMKLPDDPAKPVWWWCDALFMAPPVWSGLSATTHDPRYLAYLHREWKITSDLLWDKDEHLFFRDATYFEKREKNGSKIFWSRGNGWVMGGLARMLETLPANDPNRPFYIAKFRDMAASTLKLQGSDGLWRPGLLDAGSYPYPEISGSAFFVYAYAWGLNHGLLDPAVYGPAAQKGWAGLVSHIYQDGRLGSIQPVGAAPGAYTPGSSYVFGVGAFLLAGTEVNTLARHPAKAHLKGSHLPSLPPGHSSLP